MTEFEKGLTAFQRKEYQTAIECLLKSLKDDSSNPRTYVGLGKSYYFLGEIEAATEILSTGIAHVPSDGQLYLCRGTLRAEQLKQLDLAFADFCQAAEFNSTMLDAYYNLGQLQLRRREYLSAIEYFSKSLGDDSHKNAAAFAGKALALTELGQFDEALASCSAALSVDPSHALALSYRALVFGRLEEYGKAIVDYSRAIELLPDEPNFYFNRGRCYEGLLDYENAIGDYSRAIELKPDYGDAYNNRGNCLCKTAKEREAIHDFTQAIELGNYLAFFNRGNVYYARRRYRKAIADYTQAIKHEPQNAELFIARSKAYEEAGDRSRAREDADAALQLRDCSKSVISLV